MDNSDGDLAISSSLFTQTQNSKSGKLFEEFANLLQQLENPSNDDIDNSTIQKLVSAPENSIQALQENGYKRDLSYALQIICNGVLHFQNREKIYGSRLETFRPFLKQLSENCIKCLESIDQWSTANCSTLSNLDQESSDEVIEVTLEIVMAMSNFSSSGTKFSSKILITVLRSVNSVSISFDVSKKICSEIKKLLANEKLKIANFFIKLLGSFLKELLKKKTDINETMPDTIKLLTEMQRVNEHEIPATEPLLRLLLSSQDFVGHICEAEKDYSTRDKMQLISTVMGSLVVIPTASRSNQSYSAIKFAIDSLENSGNANVTELVEGKLLPKMCQLIDSMDNEEFGNLQEILFTKAMNSKNYFVLEVLADVYAFIVKIAPQSIAKEYLDCFSKESMPLKIKVFILPAIARNVNPQIIRLATNSSFICRFELISNKCRTEELESEDYQFVETFWKGLSLTSAQRTREELETILAICIRMRYAAAKMDEKLTLVVLGALGTLLSKGTYGQLVAVCALHLLKNVEGVTEDIVCQILRLYVKGKADDVTISLLKHFLERADVIFSLENYEKKPKMDLMTSIEESLGKLEKENISQDFNAVDKARIRNSILRLQKLL